MPSSRAVCTNDKHQRVEQIATVRIDGIAQLSPNHMLAQLAFSQVIGQRYLWIDIMRPAHFLATEQVFAFSACTTIKA